MKEIKFGIIPFVQGDESNDDKTIYSVALAYFNAGMSLNDAIEDDISYTFPSIVNLSFSIELLLKFFIVKSKIDKGCYLRSKAAYGHELKNLWNSLDEDDKLLIYSFFGNPGDEPIYNEGFIKISRDKFTSHMNALGIKPFVEWRYIHEKDENLHAIPFKDSYEIALTLIKSARYKLSS